MLNETKERISHLSFSNLRKVKLFQSFFSYTSSFVMVSNGKKVLSHKIASLPLNVQWLTVTSSTVFIGKKPFDADYSTLTDEIETNPKLPKFKVDDTVRITK